MSDVENSDDAAAERRERRPFRSALGLDSPLLREHPALMITVGYFLVSLVGMMFSWSLFRRFGVNIFDYAEITDFLMAALREPMTFLVSAGGVLVAWAIWWWAGFESRFFARRPPKSALARAYRRWSRWSAESPAATLTVVALYAYLFVGVYAGSKAGQILAGGGKQVEVVQEGEEEPRLRTLLGTTSKLVFLLDSPAGKVEIIPYESLTGIEVVAPGDERVSEGTEFPRPVEQ